MAATHKVESTLTDRYQTTVPETVRRALKLSKRDKIHYAISPEGKVVKGPKRVCKAPPFTE